MFLTVVTRGRLLPLGVNPCEGSAALDSWMGTDHGICPWGTAVVMRNFDGWGFGGGLWMVFLWGPFEGGDGEETTPGYVHQGRFRWTTRVVNQPHFLFNIPRLYIEQGGFH